MAFILFPPPLTPRATSLEFFTSKKSQFTLFLSLSSSSSSSSSSYLAEKESVLAGGGGGGIEREGSKRDNRSFSSWLLDWEGDVKRVCPIWPTGGHTGGAGGRETLEAQGRMCKTKSQEEKVTKL